MSDPGSDGRVPNGRRRGPGPGRTGPASDPLAPLRSQPSSYYLHGPSRTEVNLVAYSLARALDPDFHWIEVTRAERSPDPAESRLPGWRDPERHHFIYRAAELIPERPLTDEKLGSVVEGNEQTGTVSHIRDFVRFPDFVQDLLTRPARPGHGHVILLSNTDLTEAQYAPEPGTFRPFLRAAADEGVSLICSRTGTDRPNRFDFDFVLRINLETSSDIASAEITVEKGRSGTPFETGAHRALRDDIVVGRVAAALEGYGAPT